MRTVEKLRLLDVRNWLEVVMEAKGAKIGDVGFGFHPPQADIAIELDGHHYNISIREE